MLDILQELVYSKVFFLFIYENWIVRRRDHIISPTFQACNNRVTIISVIHRENKIFVCVIHKAIGS